MACALQRLAYADIFAQEELAVIVQPIDHLKDTVVVRLCTRTHLLDVLLEGHKREVLMQQHTSSLPHAFQGSLLIGDGGDQLSDVLYAVCRR